MIDTVTNSETCPLGPALQKYWARLSREERNMRLDAEALYSLCLQEPALDVARLTPGNHVVDAFCGAGGNAIAFARSGKLVTAIDSNADRLEMAKFNAQLFGVADKITFVHGDALATMGSCGADVLYFAPPWGGPSYSKSDRFFLDGFSPNGSEIMQLGLRLGAAIVFQVPRNFDLGEFKQFERDFMVHRDELNGELLSYTVFFSARPAALKP